MKAESDCATFYGTHSADLTIRDIVPQYSFLAFLWYDWTFKWVRYV